MYSNNLLKESKHNVNTFILFSPDATTTGYYNKALRWLYSHGFFAKWYAWLKLTKKDLSRLYPHQADVDGLGWNLTCDLFTMDSSLLVGLNYTIKGEDDISKVLTKLKGSSNVKNRAVNTLRHYLNAETRIVNFVHTPDSFNDYKNELSLLIRNKNFHQNFIHPHKHKFYLIKNEVNFKNESIFYKDVISKLTMKFIKLHEKNINIHSSEIINIIEDRLIFDLFFTKNKNLSNKIWSVKYDTILRKIDIFLKSCGLTKREYKYRWATLIICSHYFDNINKKFKRVKLDR